MALTELVSHNDRLLDTSFRANERTRFAVQKTVSASRTVQKPAPTGFRHLCVGFRPYSGCPPTSHVLKNPPVGEELGDASDAEKWLARRLINARTPSSHRATMPPDGMKLRTIAVAFQAVSAAAVFVSLGATENDLNKGFLYTGQFAWATQNISNDEEE